MKHSAALSAVSAFFLAVNCAMAAETALPLSIPCKVSTLDGGQISGRLAGVAPDGSLLVSSPSLRDIAALLQTALDRCLFQSVPSPARPGLVAARTSDGERIVGRLLRIDDASVVLTDTLNGDCIIPRGKMLSIDLLHVPQSSLTLYDSLWNGMDGWKSIGLQGKLKANWSLDGTILRGENTDRSIFLRRIELPEKFVLTIDADLPVVVGFMNGAAAAPSDRQWEMMIHPYNGQGRLFGAEENYIHVNWTTNPPGGLRKGSVELRVDRSEARCAVVSGGETIGILSHDELRKPSSGFYLGGWGFDDGNNMTFRRIIIRTQAPEPSVELNTKLDLPPELNAEAALPPEQAQGKRTRPKKKSSTSEINLQPELPSDILIGSGKTLLKGEIVRVIDGTIMFRTSYAEMSLPLANVAALQFKRAASVVSKPAGRFIVAANDGTELCADSFAPAENGFSFTSHTGMVWRIPFDSVESIQRIIE